MGQYYRQPPPTYLSFQCSGQMLCASVCVRECVPSKLIYQTVTKIGRTAINCSYRKELEIQSFPEAFSKTFVLLWMGLVCLQVFIHLCRVDQEKGSGEEGKRR